MLVVQHAHVRGAVKEAGCSYSGGVCESQAGLKGVCEASGAGMLHGEGAVLGWGG